MRHDHGITISHGQHAEYLAAMLQNREPSRQLPRIKGFTEEKVKEYMESNKCFGCHAIGHQSGRCPSRVVAADGRVSWPTR